LTPPPVPGKSLGNILMENPTMPKPIVAIPADFREIDGNVWHAAPHQYVRAALEGAGVMSFLVPALEGGNEPDAILDRVDGLLVSGSRSNVHPSLYGRTAIAADGPFDPGRDATSLPLIRRAIARGIPLLAICRGIQELNVALGGTLVSEIQDLPGRSDHRKPDVKDLDVAYGIRQTVMVEPGSCLAGVVGAGAVSVNSLHRQAISDLAPNLTVEAVADDGTVEAVSVIGASAFAVGVQWHPEYWVGRDQTSNALFKAFGQAVIAYRDAR
jgi:putative glutamine amidotransferase